MILSRLSKQRQSADVALAVELGRRIRVERITRGMSQAELGRPFTRAYVSQVESGATLPSLPALLHIAEQLDVDPCLLLPSRDAGRRRYTRTHGSQDPLHRASSG